MEGGFGARMRVEGEARRGRGDGMVGLLRLSQHDLPLRSQTTLSPHHSSFFFFSPSSFSLSSLLCLSIFCLKREEKEIGREEQETERQFFLLSLLFETHVPLFSKAKTNVLLKSSNLVSLWVVRAL